MSPIHLGMVTARTSSGRGHAAFSGPDSEWDRLALSAHAPLFSRPGWVRPWSAMARRRLEIVVAGPTARPTALLPMVARGGGLGSAADWHVPVLEAIALDDGAMDELAEAVIDGRRRVTLDFCDPGGATATGFRRALVARGFTIRERVKMHSPFVDLGAGREAFGDGLGAKKLRELGRRRRRLEEEGRVTLAVDDGSTDLDRALTEGFAVEGSGWKAATGTAIRSRPRTERFYRDVAAWAAGEGMLRLAFLRVDGLAIAFDLALVAAGREWLLKTGYSPAWSRYSPGSLLRAAAIDRAFDDGLTAYEFAGGADRWKLEWTGRCRDIGVIDAFAPGAMGDLLRGGSRAARRLRCLAHMDMRRR